MSGRYRQPKEAPKNLPDWVRHIANTIQRIETADYKHFSRPHIEAALNVKATVAKTILKRFQAQKDVGGAYLISKPDLLLHLRKVRDNPAYAAAIDREEAKLARIAALRPNRGGHAKIALTEPQLAILEQTTVATLPPGVYISQGTIWLTVTGWNDYLEKLGALIHATDNDRDTIERLLAQPTK